MKTAGQFPSIISFFLSASLLLSAGCSVFEPIGGAISQGYENTVSYFNAYYNAKRLFDEAEQEVLQAQAAQRGVKAQGISSGAQIPSGANQKFTQAIDKCSNILAFHPSSALVDDALLLIGKSNFYQGDYLKAERKFLELTTQFPNSSELLEAQLWLARTYVKNKKNREALETGETVIQIADQEGEDEISGQVSLAMASMYLELNDIEAAIRHYERASNLLGDDGERAFARTRAGDLYFQLEQYEKSLEAYLSVDEMTSDPFLVYYGKSRAAMVYRTTDREEDALRIVSELLEDYRLAQYWNEIRFEEGMTKADLGRIDEALSDFEEIDTVAARTEIGARAAYQRGRLLEEVVGDYHEAKNAYDRAQTYPVPDIQTDLRRRQRAMGQYLAIMNHRRTLDSLLALPDTIPNPNPADTLGPRTTVIDKDSLRKEVTSTEFELAELFYSEVGIPDSAAYWYDRVLAHDTDTTHLPRSMFIMADIVRDRPDLHATAPEGWYRRIVNEFPHSRYAAAAKEALGMKVAEGGASPALAEFEEAEAQCDAENYDEAIRLLRQIAEKYKGSEVAARSQYMIGWIYEQLVIEPDSAIAYYDTVVRDYGSTPYAMNLRDRLSSEIFEATPPDSAQSDKDSVQVKQIEKERIMLEERQSQQTPAPQKKPDPERIE